MRTPRSRDAGSASQVTVDDKGVDLAEMTYDVSAIESRFGLRFDPSGRLREHLAYLAGLAG